MTCSVKSIFIVLLASFIAPQALSIWDEQTYVCFPQYRHEVRLIPLNYYQKPYPEHTAQESQDKEDSKEDNLNTTPQNDIKKVHHEYHPNSYFQRDASFSSKGRTTGIMYGSDDENDLHSNWLHPKNWESPFKSGTNRINPYSKEKSQTTSSEKRFRAPYPPATKFLVKVKYEKVVIENRKEECENIQGTYIEGQCFKLAHITKPFEGARDYCKKQGGDLWIPNLFDELLYEKLAKNMPQVFSKDGVVIGVTYTEDKFLTLDSVKDVSDSYLARAATMKIVTSNEGNHDSMNPMDTTLDPLATPATAETEPPTNDMSNGDSCVGMTFDSGLKLMPAPCDVDFRFVCEFSLKSKDKVALKKVLSYA